MGVARGRSCARLRLLFSGLWNDLTGEAPLSHCFLIRFLDTSSGSTDWPVMELDEENHIILFRGYKWKISNYNFQRKFCQLPSSCLPILSYLVNIMVMFKWAYDCGWSYCRELALVVIYFYWFLFFRTVLEKNPETIRLKPKIFREFVAFWVGLFELKFRAFLIGEFFK